MTWRRGRPGVLPDPVADDRWSAVTPRADGPGGGRRSEVPDPFPSASLGAMQICMVWPRSPVSFYSPGLHARWARGRALLPNLALPTLAALTPEGVEVSIHDADFDPVPYETHARFVVLSGFYTGWPHMREMAREFRRRGKLVVIGGPFATLSADAVRPEADILVRGEAEAIWPGIVRDLERGVWKREYVAPGLVDLRESPVPRWDLVNLARYHQGLVQTSRGCPYDCEFCDVVAFVGRKVRTKTPDQVLAELEALHRLGARFAMLADDNFTVHRAHARRTLEAIRRWNRSRKRNRCCSPRSSRSTSPVTPISSSLAAEAGLAYVYVGIETTNAEALNAIHKKPNIDVDLGAAVERIQRAGIVVLGGLISGFDQDGPDVFRRHRRFLDRSGVALVLPSLLTASPGTRLHERLARENRLLAAGGKELAGDQTSGTNIIPLRMTRNELVTGHRTFRAAIYTPGAYRRRFSDLMSRLPDRRPQPPVSFLRVFVDMARRTPREVRLRAISSMLRLLCFYARPSRLRLAASYLLWFLRRPSYADVIDVHATFLPQAHESLIRETGPARREKGDMGFARAEVRREAPPVVK